MLGAQGLEPSEYAARRIFPTNGNRSTPFYKPGFLKVSALGIEEQRVRTTIDFIDPPERWSALGHDYWVIVHVMIYRA